MSAEKPRVLIITYYWPPAGGPGVQRWMKMSKYLPGYGWEPVVLTPENPDVPAIDSSLVADVDPGLQVVRARGWEPYKLYRRLLGGLSRRNVGSGKTAYFTSNEKPGWKELLARWIRGNFFVPDARIFWVRPAVKRAVQLHSEQPFDIVLSSGPPHSLHLAGRKVAKKLNIPWVADFRDPWTGVFYWDELQVGMLARVIHKRLERNVVRGSDALISVSKSIVKDLESMRGRAVDHIGNGFDPQDFGLNNTVERDPGFVILHLGTYGPTQNSQGLWGALQEIVKEDPTFSSGLQIRLIGPVDHQILDCIQAHGLEKYVRKTDYIDHREVPEALRKAHLLMTVIPNRKHNGGIIGAKVYEYLAAGQPILAIGPEAGDLDHLLTSLGLQGALGYDDAVGIGKHIRQVYRDSMASNPAPSPDIAHLSRQHLAGEVADVLNRIRGNAS
jgi:hypothetical protein